MPYDPPAGGGHTAITAGWDYACALDAAGAITCWGHPLGYRDPDTEEWVPVTPPSG